MQHWFELVRQKLSIGSVQAVNQVSQFAAQPVMCNGTTQIRGPTITAMQHQIVGIQDLTAIINQL